MSGRAVRKALRQRDLALPSPPSPEPPEDAPPPQKPSLFALLSTSDADTSDAESPPPEAPDSPPSPAPTPAPAQKKKKKKKKKGKSKPPPHEDEIDAALRELNLQSPASTAEGVRVQEQRSLFELLAVDARNFDAGNEMRRLFGRVALDAEGGRGKGRTGRRNLFVQGKEEWPVGGSGGLGMEMVSSGLDGTTEFRFVHSTAYQDVQRQFQMCVASMDPNRLIQLLHHNPYHIATLLQASEIFAHQRDHPIATDLLERALHTFGRSLHSTFPAHLAAGTARLSYLRPENREFYITAFRYLRTLQMRGTWRTALEYTRLILALDPLDDPLGMRLLVDFVALKARQPEVVLGLVAHSALRERWGTLPGMAYSVALAYGQVGNGGAAREYLAKAIVKFPWVVGRLYEEVGVEEDVPSALWGVGAGEKVQEVLGELYVVRSKDLWREPEAAGLLVEVAGGIWSLSRRGVGGVVGSGEVVEGVSEDVARHVVVSEVKSVVALLPRGWTRREMAVGDPVPPEGDVRSYEVDVGGPVEAAVGEGGRAELLREFFMSLFPHLEGGQPTEEELNRVLRERGIDLEVGELLEEGEGEGEPRVRM